MYYTVHSQEDEAAGVVVSHRGSYQAVTDPISSGDIHTTAAGGGGPHEQPPPHSMYGSFVGYCFTVNYILGVGVLGMPYAFYKGGWLLSFMCLAFVTIMATYTALWLVDVSLRAQYLKRHNKLLSGAVSGLELSARGEVNAPVSNQSHHRYEMNELTELFLGLGARRFYELLVIIYLVGALWSYSSVFSSSLASHVGLPGINGGHECDIYKDSSSACSDLYLTYMGLFAVIVVPLTCLDLTEMKLLQIVLAIFRFVSLATMMLTSIIAMYSYPNPEPDAHSSATKPYISDMKMADWSNIGLVFPIAIYAQIFHHSVPGLSHPLKRKNAAPKVFTAVLITTMLLYSALGISVGFYYGASIPQTCTIAWASYTGGHDALGDSKPWWASFISYMVVLFPPIDIISAFPLNAITLGNNLLCAFVEDERKQNLKRYKIPFRLFAALPPIVGSMIVKDLGVILKYTGCVGVLIAFIYPSFLQYYSRRTCENLSIYVENGRNHGDAGENSSEEEEDIFSQQDSNGESDFTLGQAAQMHRRKKEEAAKSMLDPNGTTGIPTYNGSIINASVAVYCVMAFSLVGLVSVIVLSILGISN